MRSRCVSCTHLAAVARQNLHSSSCSREALPAHAVRVRAILLWRCQRAGACEKKRRQHLRRSVKIMRLESSNALAQALTPCRRLPRRCCRRLAGIRAGVASSSLLLCGRERRRPERFRWNAHAARNRMDAVCGSSRTSYPRVAQRDARQGERHEGLAPHVACVGTSPYGGVTPVARRANAGDGMRGCACLKSLLCGMSVLQCMAMASRGLCMVMGAIERLVIAKVVPTAGAKSRSSAGFPLSLRAAAGRASFV